MIKLFRNLEDNVLGFEWIIRYWGKIFVRELYINFMFYFFVLYL